MLYRGLRVMGLGGDVWQGVCVCVCAVEFWQYKFVVSALRFQTDCLRPECGLRGFAKCLIRAVSGS